MALSYPMPLVPPVTRKMRPRCEGMSVRFQFSLGALAAAKALGRGAVLMSAATTVRPARHRERGSLAEEVAGAALPRIRMAAARNKLFGMSLCLAGRAGVIWVQYLMH